jgi:hypothetical protein
LCLFQALLGMDVLFTYLVPVLFLSPLSVVCISKVGMHLDACRYNEIRCAYEMSKQYDVDVYIGSHTVCTPNQFVNKLQVLGGGGGIGLL